MYGQQDVVPFYACIKCDLHVDNAAGLSTGAFIGRDCTSNFKPCVRKEMKIFCDMMFYSNFKKQNDVTLYLQVCNSDITLLATQNFSRLD